MKSAREVGRELFEHPFPGVERYRFDRWHWRQAGLTIAICEK